MRKDLVSVSKFLSLILRHKPETIGVSLDQNGWVPIQELLKAASVYNQAIKRELLDEVVFTNDKMRFSYSPDGLKIRANQGHSVEVNLALKPIEPPAVLYHGTVNKFLNSIWTSGLQKMERNHVHLSATIETAKAVGCRRGKPVVLSIEAQKMHQDGNEFFLSANGVWLTESVDIKYISRIENV
jgi:putative RNA 2'-phosphotransferase